MIYDLQKNIEIYASYASMAASVSSPAALRFLSRIPFEALLKDRSTDVRQAGWMDGWMVALT